METKINLEDCYLNKETMQYCCWNQNEDGQIVYEETPAFNLNGTDDILADVCGDRSGKVKVTLKEKKLSDFEQVRVLLAGVKNQEIYILPVTDVQSDCEFTIDTSILLPAMEYGRNKSVRILLETIADGQYFRYRLADKGRAKQDKDLQKGKKVWICEQACSEKLLLTQEGAKDIAYTLCVYMDQKGRWLFGLCANWRIHKMTQMCHLRYLTINKNLLKLRLVTDADKYGYFPDKVLFRFRSKLEAEREAYSFTIRKNRLRNNLRRFEAELDLDQVEWKSLYWDVLVVFLNPKTGDRYEASVSMTRNYRLFTAFLYSGKYKKENGFFMYPYNTSSKNLAFQYREEGEYDRWDFRMKEMVAFFLYRLLKPYWDSQQIQLVYEKFCMMAQDNGYYFFKYCMENGEEKRQKNHIYYVIDKNAPDREKLRPYKNRVVDFMSIRHMIYMQAAKLLVSTDTRNHLYAMRQRGSILKRYLRRKDLVFLQHGVTALKKVDFFYGKGKAGSCNLFVVTSDFEKGIIEKYFGYAEDEIVNSGFARWDVLEDKSEGLREILIMPTWRSWLENATAEEFKKSDYFRNYMELLNSRRFHDFLEKNDLCANFYLHSKFREFMQDFSVESKRIRLIAFGEEPANELMMRCKMLVTDYSSVCWDVFYLDKPVVFFQFDREKYEEAHGSYLDMSKELFGECADNVEGLLTYMEECAADHFVIKPQYDAMRTNFYKYFDDQNSRRICDAIVEKWGKKKEEEKADEQE